MSNKIKIKNSKVTLVISIEGNGKISDFNKDVDKLYNYLYLSGFQENISGPLIGIFYTEHGGKYEAAIPIKKPIPLNDSIKIKTLPSIKCVSIIHYGCYQTINDSFNLLKDYVKEKKLLWKFPVVEYYLKSEGLEKDYLTEIQVPI